MFDHFLLSIHPAFNGEINGRFFLTFDKNKEFEDFGFKRTVEFAVSGTPVPFGCVNIDRNVAGVEVNDKVSINGGRSDTEIEWKGGAAGCLAKIDI